MNHWKNNSLGLRVYVIADVKNTHKVKVRKSGLYEDMSSRYFTKLCEKVRVFGRAMALETVSVMIYGRGFPYSYRDLMSTVSCCINCL